MTEKESENSSSPVGEKLQKVLARVGVGSRREMERVIEKGRVKVNGQVASLGDRVELTDRVEIDGKRIHLVTKNNKSRNNLLTA